MREAAMQLPKGSFDYLLVDGNKVPEGLPAPAEAVVKGDATSSCIAAASVIAKVSALSHFFLANIPFLCYYAARMQPNASYKKSVPLCPPLIPLFLSFPSFVLYQQLA
eukprot:scaffold94663_cov18-Tisochrysis_lutea.AAC.1